MIQTGIHDKLYLKAKLDAKIQNKRTRFGNISRNNDNYLKKNDFER